MKKHDFGAWFLLCGLLFLFAPGVSAMAEKTEPLFAFAAQAEEVRPGGSFAVTCTPARALDDGTLFPVLNKPFYGRRGEPR